jgi:hypothetical protein
MRIYTRRIYFSPLTGTIQIVAKKLLIRVYARI